MDNDSQPKEEKLLPLGEPTLHLNPPPSPGVPSRKAQSWGTVVSIIIIVLMIVIGAFYVWGKRLEQNRVVFPSATEGPVRQ